MGGVLGGYRVQIAMGIHQHAGRLFSSSSVILTQVIDLQLLQVGTCDVGHFMCDV
jgi:hypothetical protein